MSFRVRHITAQDVPCAGKWCALARSPNRSSHSGGIHMRISFAGLTSRGCRFARIAAAFALLMLSVAAFAQDQPGAAPTREVGGEASLKVPDLSTVNFLGMNGHNLLLIGIAFCIFGLLFGLVIYTRLKNLPVHRSMRDISELIRSEERRVGKE